MQSELVEGDRCYSIIGAFYEVYNYFGCGLSESVYAGALEYELVDRGHEVAREVAVDVSYKGRHVAWQRLDMIVDRSIIVELRATEKLPPFAERQLISYLHASPIELGLLLHFGPKARFQRFIDYPKKKFVDIAVHSCHSCSNGFQADSEQPIRNTNDTHE